MWYVLILLLNGQFLHLKPDRECTSQSSSLPNYISALCNVRCPFILMRVLSRVTYLIVGKSPDLIRRLGGCFATKGSKIVFADFVLLMVQESSMSSPPTLIIVADCDCESHYVPHTLPRNQNLSSFNQPVGTHSLSGWNILLRLHIP